MKKGVFFLAVGLLVFLAIAGQPVAAEDNWTQPTLYDFYTHFYPPSLDPMLRARLLEEAVLNDFRIIQNRVHNPYKMMKDEWRRLDSGSRLAEKIGLTWLYSTVEKSASPDQLVRVLVTKPKDIEKFVAMEWFGKFNRPWKSHQGLLIDIHTHQGEIGMSYDSIGTLERSLVKAYEKGLDGVVLTNHDILPDDLEARVKELKAQGKIPRWFIVILGMEYTSTDVGHLLLIGLKEAPAPGMGFADVCREVHCQGGKVIVAHPTGIESMIAQNPVVDGVIQDQILFPNVLGMIEKDGRRMPVFASSDSHFPSWYGTNATRVFATGRTAQDVIDAIGEGKVEPVLNPLFAKAQRAVPRIGTLFSLAKAKNRFETAIARAMGADYVLVGENSLVPDTAKIDAAYGKYIFSYTKNDRPRENRVEVRWAFSF